jgi:hypothetical protein
LVVLEPVPVIVLLVEALELPGSVAIVGVPVPAIVDPDDVQPVR